MFLLPNVALGANESQAYAKEQKLMSALPSSVKVNAPS